LGRCVPQPERRLEPWRTRHPIAAGIATRKEDPIVSTALRIDRRDLAAPASRLRIFTRTNLDRIPQLEALSAYERAAMKAVAWVLPFRVNPYVIDELIDWSRVPEDPIYQMTFPQPGMLEKPDLDRMLTLVQDDASAERLAAEAREIQQRLNPHPAGQLDLNVPTIEGERVPGLQHKYDETVLFFPAAGQTCHAYCSYCFRWAQFVGMEDLKFAARETDGLVGYLKDHPQVTSVLITGGDPMVMKAHVLRRYIEPLLAPELEHVESIRIGTRAPVFWPHRFVSDGDADELKALFQRVADAGKTLALMAHYSHPRELATPMAERAVKAIQDSGAVIRCQAPLIRHVNDDAETWADLWRRQVRLGAIPYYMFVERDTGARRYFEVPLARALEIFNGAYRTVSGLARTVRGPSMSALPGKVLIDGVAEIQGEKVFVLKLLQARRAEWVGRPFFARFDPLATWLDDLQPAFGESEFFYESELRELGRAIDGEAGSR
jgi:KamA family protein